MSRKTSLLLAVLLLLSVGGTSVIAQDRGPTRAPASEQVQEKLRKIRSALAIEQRELQARHVRCRTLRCINRTLTRQQRQIRRLQNRLARVEHDFYVCEKLIDVTQYGDYQRAGGGAITGLDLTVAPVQVDWQVVHWDC